MPGGYLWAVAIVAVYTLAALRPLRRPPPLGFVSFVLAYLLNELPFVAFAWLLAWTLVALVQGDLDSTGGLAVLGLAVLTAFGLAEVARRGCWLAGRSSGRSSAISAPAGDPCTSPAAVRAGVAGRASCSCPSRCGAATSSGSGTSATAMRGGATGSTCTAPGPARRAGARC